MWHQFIILLFTINLLLHSTFELGINEMDFCCSNTCCCSLCTAEQCRLPDQPGKQCRCYNTTDVTCLRFTNFIYKPETIELPNQVQIFSVLPDQPIMAQVIPMGIKELDIDPLCCAVKNCPAWIKCRNPSSTKRDQSASQTMPIPLFIIACILFALITVTTIGLCIAASVYINDKRRNCDIYSRTERY
ncbi:unnamed protein product [Cercopithifilaria johnstoni]|uniref:Uncharacterized protein n=1 Tax=Cercopithifilaria johnstoni TaxID=2874296 RepID=A0A8J2M9D7_9BILA|nr:unnamed protein product [Cercopithifilaria johnstoni]